MVAGLKDLFWSSWWSLGLEDDIICASYLWVREWFCRPILDLQSCAQSGQWKFAFVAGIEAAKWRRSLADCAWWRRSSSSADDADCVNRPIEGWSVNRISTCRFATPPSRQDLEMGDISFTENLCGRVFKVGESLHGGNPTLSAMDVGFQWHGKASQLENILGCML